MTRRIDELGRLVIPKEIRKNLKIKDNDQVEINVIDNKIILSKFENLQKNQIITMFINCLKKILNKNVLFTSRDKIIDHALLNKEEVNSLSLDIVNIIENRRMVINTNYQNDYYSISPLIINGDLYGSLIIYDKETINDKDIEIIKFSQMFLEKYLE